MNKPRTTLCCFFCCYLLIKMLLAFDWLSHEFRTSFFFFQLFCSLSSRIESISIDVWHPPVAMRLQKEKMLTTRLEDIFCPLINSQHFSLAAKQR